MSQQHGANPQQVTGYQIGDVVNGHVFTGSAWVPLAQPTSPVGAPLPGAPHPEPARVVNAFSPAASSRWGTPGVGPVLAHVPVKQGMARGTKVALAVLGLVVGGVFVLMVASAIVIPVFLNQREGGYQAAVQSDLRDAATAAETYWAASGTPPVDAQVLDDYGWSPGPGVSIFLAASTPDGYCLEGRHMSLPGQVWSFASARGLAEGPCFQPRP